MDKDIKKLQRDILNAVVAKKTSIRRKWMEVNALANAHQLVLLPYQAQLSYMTQVVEERRELLSQIQASQDHDHVHNAAVEESSCSDDLESQSEAGAKTSDSGSES